MSLLAGMMIRQYFWAHLEFFFFFISSPLSYYKHWAVSIFHSQLFTGAKMKYQCSFCYHCQRRLTEYHTYCTETCLTRLHKAKDSDFILNLVSYILVMKGTGQPVRPTSTAFSTVFFLLLSLRHGFDGRTFFLSSPKSAYRARGQGILTSDEWLHNSYHPPTRA